MFLPCREQLAQALLQPSELILLPQLCLALCLLQSPGVAVPPHASGAPRAAGSLLTLLCYGVALRAQGLVNHPLQLSSLSEKCKVYRRPPPPLPWQPEEPEPNLLFIGLSIFIRQLRGKEKKKKKKHLLIEQHLFFHVSCTLEWRGSTWEQHAPRQEEELSLCCCSLVCVCVWWNLVPRFLGVSLLLLFFFSEQDLGMGITLCDLSAVSEFCVSAPRALSSPLHILSQEGRK